MIFLAFTGLLLPGLAWWAWLGRRREDPLVSLAQIIGVSFSLIILLAGVGFWLGIRFNRLSIALLLIIFCLLTFTGLLKKGVRLQRRHCTHIGVGLVLFGAAISWRLFQARDLLLPSWVDSQHHYLIIRVILESGGVPGDLSPYLAMPFNYHYGFHIITALFSVISGLPIGKAMLLFGQVLNAIVGLSVYTLGKSLWRNWRPALAAALLVSFATRMPAYYLSWGRYTLLTGLVLLPLAMAQAINIVRGKDLKRNLIVFALLTAGLLLTHYFAAVLLVIFLGFIALVIIIRGRKNLPRTLLHLSGLLTSAAAGLVMAAPWLLRMAQSTISDLMFETNLPESANSFLNSDSLKYIWQLLSPSSNHWLLVPAGFGLLIVLIQRNKLGFSLWSITLAAMTLPWGLNLRPFRPDHFAIVLFLPIALLAGLTFWYFGNWVAKQLKERWLSTVMLLLAILGWSAWGFDLNRTIANPATVLATGADIDALNWVIENTPPDARFFINTEHWQGGVYRGIDGGSWLLPYTGRWAVVPTIFYGFSPDREWTQTIRDWGQAANKIVTCTDDFWSLVDEAELDWIYLRLIRGSLRVGALSGCEGIKIMYQNESIVIFSIER